MIAFEVFNADGSLQINLASRLTKIIGVSEINIGAPGSISNPLLKNGTIWFTVIPLVSDYNSSAMLPTFTKNESTGVITWTNNYFSPRTATLIYGVYSNGNN